MQTIELSQTWHDAVRACARIGEPRSMSIVFDEASEHFKELLGERCIMFRGRYFPSDCKIVEDNDPFLWFSFVESGNTALRRYKKKYGVKWKDDFMFELFNMYYIDKTWPGKEAAEKCETIKKMDGEQKMLAIKVLESKP